MPEMSCFTAFFCVLYQSKRGENVDELQNNKNLTEIALKNGCAEVGFSCIKEIICQTIAGSLAGGAEKLIYAISLVYRLSDAVIDTITDCPTHTYFHHYRTVNAALDRAMLECGNYIEKQGFRYIPVAASQSIEQFEGLFQHKTAARLAGLGTIGKSGLFLSKKHGARVRLGTVLTDMPFETGTPCTDDLCGDCTVCASLCPAMAISGRKFLVEDKDIIDRRACSEYMKKQFQHIGRGAVCGICMKNCAYTNNLEK